MKYRKDRRGGGRAVPPPFADLAFAEALEGEKATGWSRRARQEQKARQLCRQVQRALNLALGGECGDDVLRALYVAEVTPAPDAGHLMVHVVVPGGVSVVEVLERLGRVGPRLRGIVARVVTRKRAPELAFVPVAGGGGL